MENQHLGKKSPALERKYEKVLHPAVCGKLTYFSRKLPPPPPLTIVMVHPLPEGSINWIDLLILHGFEK